MVILGPNGLLISPHMTSACILPETWRILAHGLAVDCNMLGAKRAYQLLCFSTPSSKASNKAV